MSVTHASFSSPSVPWRRAAGRRAALPYVAVAGALLLAGCGPGDATDGGAPSAAVRDSAGVVVAEYAGEVPEARTHRLTGEPELVIGREGDPAYELFRARGVQALPDGTVVVANGGTDELRYYGPDGTHLRDVGGEGEGPGEFVTISWVDARPGDTVVVGDSRMRRDTWLGPSGEVARVESWAQALEPVFPEGAAGCITARSAGYLADGTLVAQGTSCVVLDGSEGPGAWIVDLQMVRDGERIRTPRMEHLQVWKFPSREIRGGYTTLPFGWRMSHAVGADRVFTATGDRHEVRSWDGNGELRTVRRVRAERRPVTPEHVERYEAGLRERGAEPSPEIEYPDSLPTWDALLAAEDGALWAGAYVAPGDTTRAWTVFPAEVGGGDGLRRVVLPAGVELHAVRDGRLYGVRTDPALGIQQVVVYRLERR